jgi:hypothetical protein
VDASDPDRRRALRSWLAPGALLVYVAALYGRTALFHDGLFERDGYYHARLAFLLPERWLSRSFPWTQLSTWRDAYCDKELVYHLLIAPFARLAPSPLAGTLFFSVLLAVCVVCALYLVLRARGVPWPAWFAAFPLATGGLFVARLGMIRSHVLSMLLLVLGVHLLLERRWRAVLLLGFVHAWCYTFPFVLAMTAAPLALGLWAGQGKGEGGLDWRTPLAAFAGSALGLAIHPYSPVTLENLLTILQIFVLGNKGAEASGLELGNEIYRYPLPVFFDIYPLLLLSMPALLLAVLLGWRHLTAEARGLTAACTFWFGMCVAAPRFTEYQVPLFALAAGLVTRDLWSGWAPLQAWLSRGAGRRWAAGAAALALLAGFHARSFSFYEAYHREAAPPLRFEGAARWMAAHLAPGETVINLYWDDFPELFYAAPRQHYLWGLDPTYSLRFDAGKTLLLERMRQRQAPLDGRALAEAAGSRTLVLRAERATRYPELKRAPFREVYRDGAAVVYRVDLL